MKTVGPFAVALVVALSQVGIASAAQHSVRTPLGEKVVHSRFAPVLLLWAATSWLSLRYGLTREDRQALGGLSRGLRLV